MREMIAAQGLNKYYYSGFMGRRKSVQALKGVSFKVYEGEIYGLLGPNGAGKTTTVKIIATLLAPDEGSATVAGLDVVKDYKAVRDRIGVMLSVERGFFWKLSGEENLRYFGMLYGLSGKELESRIRNALKTVGLLGLGGDKKLFEDMSLGMRARLGLARVLVKDPEIMILDEPTLGLDPQSARHIRRLLRRAVNEGKTVLVTTHNMFEAEMLCDRIGIIRDGVIIAEGTPAELKARVSSHTPITVRVRTGLDSLEKIVSVLKENGVLVDSKRVEPGVWQLDILAHRGEEDNVLEILYTATKSLGGTRIIESRIHEPTLEDVFIALTAGG